MPGIEKQKTTYCAFDLSNDASISIMFKIPWNWKDLLGL